MTLLGLLPLLALPLLLAACTPSAASGRRGLLLGLVLWGAAGTAIVEILSAFNQVRRGPLLGAWVVVIGLAAIVISRRRVVLRRWSISLPRRIEPWVLMILLGSLATAEFVVCLRSPPTSWDSMTYHMARVLHWLQDGDVAHYPTTITRQLWMAPWTEYQIAQVHGLAGWDLFDNLVQWTCGVMVTLLTFLLARDLGLSRRAALVASVATATVPMVVVQATNTGTDLAAAMWTLAFVLGVRLDLRTPTPGGALLCGAAAGLAVLTKATAAVFVIPFAVVWAVQRVRSPEWRRRSVAGVASAVAIALVVVGPFFLSNYQTWHRPLGPADAVSTTNSTSHAPSDVIATGTRTLATLLVTPSSRFNGAIQGAAKATVDAVGREPDDPATTFPGNTFQVKFERDEDYASAPLHAALVFVGLVYVVWARRRERDLLMHAGLAACAALLFAALVRWSVWNNRLDLALLVLMMPLAAAGLRRLRSPVRLAIVSLLFLSAFGWLAINYARPLVGQASILRLSRDRIMFEKRPDLYQPYVDAATVVAGLHPRRVGLVLGGDDWEYPLWVLVHRRDPRVRFADGRLNDWKGYGRRPPLDVIVCTDLSAVECTPSAGWRVASDGRVRVLSRT